MKNNNGITLVALVISIIVLLILAGISISTVVGDNGIISKATLASEVTKENAEDEKKQFEDVSDYIDNEILGTSNSNPKNTYGFYFEKLYNTTLNGNKVSIILHENTSAEMYMNDVLYTNFEPGLIIYDSFKIDLSAISFGIGIVSPDGKEINIDGLIFVLEEKNSVNLPVYIRIHETLDEKTESYVYSATILDTIPSTPQETDMYITKDYIYTYRNNVSDNSFIGWRVDGVTTAEYSTILKEEFNITIEDTLKPINDNNYGQILSHINNIPVVAASFSNDTAMIVSPELPDTIVNLEDVFYGCTSLKTVTNIPPNTKSLHHAFYNCTSLETLNISIPNTVTSMEDAFRNCTSLTGNITIHSDYITYYGDCFTGTIKPIKIIGSCSDTIKSNLASTANNNNVTY